MFSSMVVSTWERNQEVRALCPERPCMRSSRHRFQSIQVFAVLWALSTVSAILVSMIFRPACDKVRAISCGTFHHIIYHCASSIGSRLSDSSPSLLSAASLVSYTSTNSSSSSSSRPSLPTPPLATGILPAACGSRSLGLSGLHVPLVPAAPGPEEGRAPHLHLSI